MTYWKKMKITDGNDEDENVGGDDDNDDNDGDIDSDKNDSSKKTKKE